MKRTLATVLAVVLAMLLMIPAMAEITDPSEARVAVVIYPSSNTTIQVMMAGFLQTAENLGMKTLYLGGVPSAEAIFRKNHGELDDVERMMVGIIEKSEDAAIEKEDEFPTEEPEDGAEETEE